MFISRRQTSLKQNRPVRKIELQPADWILEGLSVISLAIFFGVMLYHYRLLPETIPTHFNSAGEPDDWGRRDTIWVLPAIGVITWLIMTLVSRIPNTFNFPIPITEANATRQYTMALRLVRILKLVVILIFFYIAYSTIHSALHPGTGIGLWFLPVILAVTLLPVGIYVVLARRNR